MLNVCEIFSSVQGESSRSGHLCVFVRLSGCNLKCSWCDTRYACDEPGRPMKYLEVMDEVDKYRINLVEITGGEPLLQPDVIHLCRNLLEEEFTVLVETNGSQDISILPKGVHRIVDVKCPGSGMADSFLMDNLNHLNEGDELKFVLASIDDAEWAIKFCVDHDYVNVGEVIFSPVSSTLPYNVLADWMVDNKLSGVKIGVQLHKILWNDVVRK
jgi:7-carboxy-7-deazaguanine synthase